MKEIVSLPDAATLGVLVMIGGALKKTPRFPDAWIPFALILLSGLWGWLISHFVLDGLIAGMKSGAFAIVGNQLFRQGKEALGFSPSSPSTPGNGPGVVSIVMLFGLLFLTPGCLTTEKVALGQVTVAAQNVDGAMTRWGAFVRQSNLSAAAQSPVKTQFEAYTLASGTLEARIRQWKAQTNAPMPADVTLLTSALLLKASDLTNQVNQLIR